MRVLRIILPLALVAMAILIGVKVVPMTTSAGQERPLRIGFAPWVGYDIILYAEELGIFERHGLNVELIRFDESNDVVRAISRGHLDAGFSNFGRALIFEREMQPMHVIFVTNISCGADGIVARPGIESVSDLAGKRIGCKRWAVNQLILAEALRAHGLTLSDVTSVDVTNTVAQRMLREGELDAAVLWEPDVSELAIDIGGSVIYRTSDLDSLVIDSLVTRSDNLPHLEPHMLRLREAWFELIETVERDPDKAFAAVANRLGQTPEQVASAWAGIRPGDLELNRTILSEVVFDGVLRETAHMLGIDSDLPIGFLPIPNSLGQRK